MIQICVILTNTEAQLGHFIRIIPFAFLWNFHKIEKLINYQKKKIEKVVHTHNRLTKQADVSIPKILLTNVKFINTDLNI